MSTEQKIKKFPPSYIAELCPKGYVMRVEQIKQECLEALTINVSTPELVKSYEAKMEQDAQRQAAVNAQATREAEERVKIEEALQKKEQEAENARLAQIESRFNLRYGGDLSKSLWGAQVKGFKTLKGKFYTVDLPFKVVTCNQYACLVSIRMTNLSFSLLREADDFVGSYVSQGYVTPIGADTRGNLLMRRIAAE